MRDLALHYLGPGADFAPAAYAITWLSFDLVVPRYVVVAYKLGLAGRRRAYDRQASTAAAN